MIDKFKKVDERFSKLSKKYQKNLEPGMKTPIHPDFQFPYNGICAFIAVTGRGKSYNYMKMIAPQEVLFDKPVFEQVVICSTSAEFDQTVKTFKKAIVKTEIIFVNDNDLLDWLSDYISMYIIYITIMTFINSGLQDPEHEMYNISFVKSITPLRFTSPFCFIKQYISGSGSCKPLLINVIIVI